MPAIEPQASNKKGSVLVVDDDVLVAKALRRRLAGAYWDVRIARSVAEARDALRKRYDAVLVDVSLPDGSGFDVIDAAHAAQPGTPVLITTGSTHAADVNRALRMGAYCLCKPFDVEDVNGFLDGCLGSPRPTVEDLVEKRVAADDLTPSHRDILLAAYVSCNQKTIALALGKDLENVKRQISDMRLRTGRNSLEDIVAPIRAAAFVRRRK